MKENIAAKEITDALLGVDFRTIFLGGKAYTIYPPTFKILARGLREWSNLKFNEENQTALKVISQIPKNSDSMLKGIAFFIIGDIKFYRWKAWLLFRKLKKGTPTPTPKETSEAIDNIVGLIQARDFFESAALLKNVVKTMAAHPKL